MTSCYTERHSAVACVVKRLRGRQGRRIDQATAASKIQRLNNVVMDKEPLLNASAGHSGYGTVSAVELETTLPVNVPMPETPLSTDDQCTGKVPFLKDYYFEKVYTATADTLYSCFCTRGGLGLKNCCPKKCLCNPCCQCCGEDQKAEDIQHRLKIHYMDPVQRCCSKLRGNKIRKWRSISFFGLKLFFQILMIALTTAQISLFAEKRSAVPRFILMSKETFNHIFLDFGCRDSNVVYSMDDLYHQIQRIADMYYNIQTRAVAPFDYFEDGNATNPIGPPLLQVCVKQYDKWKFDAATHDIYLSEETHIYNISLYDEKNETCYHPHNCTVQAQLEPYVNASSIGSIMSLTVQFKLTSFFIDHEEMRYISCVTFDIQIVFSNAQLNGAIPVEVLANPNISDCNRAQKNTRFYDEVPLKFAALDGFVISAAVIYMILCFLSILGDCILTCDTYEFFRSEYLFKDWFARPTLRDVMSLQNLWFNVTIIGINGLVIAGTAMKFNLTYKVIFSLDFDYWTTFILGLGVFFQWCGLLLYLHHFENFKMLFVTLRLSLPSVIRLIVCASVLYVASMLLGWIVLGPYHPKFADTTITAESLFSLFNGDDMFNTFREMPQTPTALLYFSKIYFYLFIAFFIYVVGNMVIGLIFDTYQKLNEHKESRCKPALYEYAFDGGEALQKRRIDKVLQAANPTTNGLKTTQLTEQQQGAEEEGEEQSHGVPGQPPSVAQVEIHPSTAGARPCAPPSAADAN